MKSSLPQDTSRRVTGPDPVPPVVKPPGSPSNAQAIQNAQSVHDVQNTQVETPVLQPDTGALDQALTPPTKAQGRAAEMVSLLMDDEPAEAQALTQSSSQNTSQTASQARSQSPLQATISPPAQASETERLEEALTSLSEPDFMAYAEDVLQVKFGLKHSAAGHGAKALWKAYHQPSVAHTVQALAALSGAPQGIEVVRGALNPVLGRLPASTRPLIDKLFLAGPQSGLRLQRLSTVVDGDFQDINTFKALHALVNDLGPEVVQALPQTVQQGLMELSRKTGKDAIENGLIILGDVVKHYDTLSDGELTLGDLRATADLLKSSTPVVLTVLPERLRERVLRLGEDNLTRGLSTLASVSKNIEVLQDDDWNAKDIAAIYELIYTLKEDVNTLKGMLPPRATAAIEKLERALGQEFRQHVDDVYRLLGAPNDAFVKSAFDWLVAPDPLKRFNAGVGFLEALGKQWGAQSEGFQQAMNFLKVDNSLLPAFKQLMDGQAPAASRAQALQEIARSYQVRGEVIFDRVTPQLGAQASAVADAAQITEESIARALLEVRQQDIAAGLPDALKLAPERQQFLTRTLAEQGYDAEEVQRVIDMVVRTGDDADDALAVLSELEPAKVTRLFENAGEASEAMLRHYAQRSQALDKSLAELATSDTARDALRRAFVYDDDLSPKLFNTALENVQKLGRHADAALLEMADNPQRLKTALTTISDRGVDMLRHLPARRQLTEEALERLGGALGREMGQEAQEKALNMLARNPDVTEKALKTALSTLESFGPEKSARALQLLAQMGDEMTGMVFRNPTLGKPFLSGATDLMPVFEKYGMQAVDYLPKMVKGLGKAVPALGAVVAAQDTLRMGTIALTGEYQGKRYADPEVRALALLAASANGLDTALGIAEAFGVGNVAFPLQLGLAGVEVGLDLMIEHFNEHPEKMPPAMRQSIRYAAVSAAVAGVIAVPVTGGASLAGTVAIARIYGFEGTADILNEMTRDLGQQGLQAAAYLGDLHAQAMDKGLENMATGIHGVADMIRYPERYAQMFQQEVSEIVELGLNRLQETLSSAVEQTEENLTLAYELLTDVVNDPQKYATALQDQALAVGQQLAEKTAQGAAHLKTLLTDAVHQGKVTVAEGFQQLYALGSEGVTQARDWAEGLLAEGGRQAEALQALTLDMIQNPEVYGERAKDYAQTLMVALKNRVVAEAKDAKAALQTLAAAAAQGAGQAMQMVEDFAAAGQAAGEALVQDIKNLPADVAKAVTRGYTQAVALGKASQDLMIYVANHPEEALQKAGEWGQDAVAQTYLKLVDSVKQAGDAVDHKLKETLKAIDNVYTTARQDLESYATRTGAVIDRFEDTLTELMISGQDIGGDLLDKHWDVLQQRMPEVLNALADLRDAPVDLLLRIAGKDRRYVAQVANILVQKAQRLGTQALNGLKSLGEEGLKGLAQLAAVPGRLSRQAYQALAEAGKAGLQKIEALAIAAGATADQALSTLKGLGSRGVAYLRTVAQRNQAMAGRVMDTLSEMGNTGIQTLTRWAMESSSLSQAAFLEIKAQGAASVTALKQIALGSQRLANQAIDALAGLGGRAESALRQIGEQRREYARRSINALQQLGSQAIDSIEAIARRYDVSVKSHALDALQGLSRANQAIARVSQDLWRSGSAGVKTVMRSAQRANRVAVQMQRLVAQQIRQGWQNSTVDVLRWDFWNGEVDLRPLERAIRPLLQQAAEVGDVALRRLKAMVRDYLIQDLKAPEAIVRRLL